MKKIIFCLLRMDILAVFLAFLSLISLNLTIMVPAEVSGLGASVTAITGLHLWEFSAFGFLLMVAPVVIILMSKMYTKMQNAHLILFGVLLLALFGYNDGIVVGREWIWSITGGAIHYERAMVVYPFLLIMSTSILMIHMEFADFFNEFESIFEEDYASDDEYYDSYAR